MVASDYVEFFEDKDVSKTRVLRTYKNPVTSVNQALRSYRVGMSTLMVRKRMAISVWPQKPPPYSYLEDFDMVLRLLARGSLQPIRNSLARRRRHHNNLSLNSALQLAEWQHWLENLYSLGMPETQAATARTYAQTRINRIQAQELILGGDRRSALAIARATPNLSERVKLSIATSLPLKLLRRRWK